MGIHLDGYGVGAVRESAWLAEPSSLVANEGDGLQRPTRCGGCATSGASILSMAMVWDVVVGVAQVERGCNTGMGRHEQRSGEGNM